MDALKELHECIKGMDIFHTLMDKPARTLVRACYKCVNPIVHGLS